METILSKYDSAILLKIITRVGKKPFQQIDRNGKVVTNSILKGNTIYHTIPYLSISYHNIPYHYHTISFIFTIPYLSFFAEKPSILFKNNKNVICSIKITFNCHMMSTCPFHSLNKEEKRHLKFSNLYIPKCPISSRQYHFMDSFLTISTRQEIS